MAWVIAPMLPFASPMFFGSVNRSMWKYAMANAEPTSPGSPVSAAPMNAPRTCSDSKYSSTRSFMLTVSMVERTSSSPVARALSNNSDNVGAGAST